VLVFDAWNGEERPDPLCVHGLPRVNFLDRKGFLKFIDQLVALKAKHDEVANPICVNVFRKFVIASWPRISVANDVRNIRNADGVLSDVQE
jgi:hypothetical protein